MDKAGLLQLPGRPEEQDWLRERLEVLTAREGIALDAAIQRHPAQDSTEVVSLLASLDEYEVLGGIQSYEDLGLYTWRRPTPGSWRCGTTSTWTSWAGSMRHSTPAGSQGAAMWYIRERG